MLVSGTRLGDDIRWRITLDTKHAFYAVTRTNRLSGHLLTVRLRIKCCQIPVSPVKSTYSQTVQSSSNANTFQLFQQESSIKSLQLTVLPPTPHKACGNFSVQTLAAYVSVAVSHTDHCIVIREGGVGNPKSAPTAFNN